MKATNNDTVTENATVSPNCRKKRPIIPFITATGMNTATIDAVVAALEARDGEAAARAMHRHLDAVLGELESFAQDRPELFADLNTMKGSET